MKVFLNTNYREQGAQQLVNYLDKDKGLENRVGEEMSNDEITTFIEKSEEYGFEREMIISPKNGHKLSDDQFSLYTRQLMSEFCKGRPSATYCFAVHRDTDHPHVHVALTGTKRDLWVDERDCDQLRERAHKQFYDQHHDLSKELIQQLEEEEELQEELKYDQEMEPDLEVPHEQSHDQGQVQGTDS